MNSKKNISKSKSQDDSENVFKKITKNTGLYVKQKYPFLILFLAGILIVSALNFLKISTADSVANFAVSDFEVGQISDRTITASKSLGADESYPVEIQRGEKIIKKGFPVTEEAIVKLKKMSASPVYIDYRAFSNGELFILVLAVLWYLLFLSVPLGHDISIKEASLHVVFFIVTYAAAVFFRKLQFFSSPYSICILIPCSLFVMLITILYGQSSAVLFSLVASLGILQATDFELVPFMYTLMTCVISSAIVRKIEKRIDLVIGSIYLSFVNCVAITLLNVIFSQGFEDLGRIYFGVIVNGFISGILTLGFLTPLEILMNTASVFRLMELSDLNTPLMQRMLIVASGTYNHSMMVAQLAESACREIGANSLLARVGAYYHDMGKIEQSEYFVENQHGENKHDDINPTLSASVIKSHVKKGVEKAYELHLPKPIIDIIAEHHGNSTIKYFYHEAKEKDPTLSPEDFSYPGNPPSTRESAVVMLADTVEAACRTLENPSVSRLEKFINKLILDKMDEKQLDNCPLTFRDLTKIKESFVQVLAGYYHSRIKYPDQNEQQKNNSEQNSKESQLISKDEFSNQIQKNISKTK